MRERGIVDFDPTGLCVWKADQEMFDFLCQLLWPLIDGFWVTFVFSYGMFPNKMFVQSEFFKEVAACASKFHEDRIITYFETCSVEIAKIAANSFIQMGIFDKSKMD